MISQEFQIKDAFHKFIDQSMFPCIGAKASLAKNGSSCLVVGNMACPAEDRRILNFLYSFIDEYRAGPYNLYSAAVIFNSPGQLSETQFE